MGISVLSLEPAMAVEMLSFEPSGTLCRSLTGAHSRVDMSRFRHIGGCMGLGCV